MTQNGPAVGSAATNFGIVAWIVYGVLSGNGHWIGAAIGALAVACAIVAHEYSKSAVKIMNCTTMAFFAFALVTTIAVGPWLFKSYNIWLTWAVLAHEISVMIVASGLGTLMTLNLILGVLRRLNFVRAPLPLSDG